MPSGLAAVPPAQLPSKYRDVVKIALQPRQTRAFILAAVSWHLLLTSALLKTISLSLVSPLTLAVSLLSFGLGILPLLARRKRALSTITTPPSRLPSSRAQQLSAALSSPTLLPSTSHHVVAFLVLAMSYAALLTLQTGGWGPQIWVESHGSFYLNERFLYLVGQSVVLGAVYAFFFRSLPSPDAVASPFFDPSVLSSGAVVTIKDRVVKVFASRLPKVAAVAALASITNVVVYGLIRIRLWSGLLLVIGTRGLMRRLLVPSFRVDFSYIEVALRMGLFSMAAVCAVETAYLLLDVYLSHPLPAVSKYAKSPNRLLLDGIDEPILFFSNHAFSEVARLSANDKDSRAAIYRDVNADVTAWVHIRDRCLSLLDAHKQFVIRRGQLPPPAQTTAQPAAQQVVQQQQQKRSAQPAPQTIWDRLAVGQTMANQNVASTSQSPTAAPATAAATANTNRSPASTPSLLSLHSIQKAIIGVTTLGWKSVPQDAKHVLFGPRRQQALVGDSPAFEAASVVGRDAARTVGAVLTLKELLCHSLAEDPYGSVQRDIQRVLVAMVDLDTEIRRFGLELEQRAEKIDEKLGKLEAAANSSSAKEGAGGSGRAECQEHLRDAWKTSGAQNVNLSLTASIREILDTFGKFDLQLDDELEVKLAECLS